jgi:hypothetical protein
VTLLLQAPKVADRKFPLSPLDVGVTSLPATARILHTPGMADIDTRVTVGAFLAAAALAAFVFFSGVRETMTALDMAALFGPIALFLVGFGLWSWRRTSRLARSYLDLTFSRDGVSVVDHDGFKTVEWSEPYRAFLVVLLSHERDDSGHPHFYHIDVIHPKAERYVPLVMIPRPADVRALEKRTKEFAALFGLTAYARDGDATAPLR